jgi:hypothetical protein
LATHIRESQAVPVAARFGADMTERRAQQTVPTNTIRKLTVFEM